MDEVTFLSSERARPCQKPPLMRTPSKEERRSQGSWNTIDQLVYAWSEADQLEHDGKMLRWLIARLSANAMSL